jgi:uncharacterized BrkB/YihY/UPF0761 family membrane protein/predicted GNAT family acetyltransferase
VKALRARWERLRASAEVRFDDLRERSDLVRLGTVIYQRDGAVGGRLLGSAIAFRLFLFFVPLLLLIVGLAGFLASLIDADQASDTVGVSGAMSRQIDAAFSQSNGARWGATLTGLVGALWAGRSLGTVLSGASAVAWGLPAKDSPLTARAMGSLVGLLVGIGLVSVLVNRIRAEVGVAIGSVSFVAAAALYAAAWVLVATTLPRTTSDPASSLPGAAVVGLTLATLQAVSQLFLPGQIERASELYGGLAATVATLGWFFFMGRSMAFSFVLDATVHDHFGGTAKAVLSLPVLRAVPANVPRLARYLHLPEHEPGTLDDETDGPTTHGEHTMDQGDQGEQAEQGGGIVDDPSTSRFVHVVDGLEAELVYRAEEGRLVLVHTGVPDELGGRGLGGRLVRAALARAARTGEVIAPWCPFARRWLEEHPDEASTVTIDWSPPPARR